MQIHHIHIEYKNRWVLDPDLGQVQRREEIIQPSGASLMAIPAGQFDSTPDGQEFTADESGTFDLPDDVAEWLLTLPGWTPGLSPFAPETPAPAKTRAKKAAAD